MKKQVTLLMFLLLSVFLIAAQGTIRFSDATNALQLTRSSDSGLAIHYGIEAVDFKDIQANNGTYTEISIRDYTYTNKTGFPQLPLVRQLISVPVGADVLTGLTNVRTQSVDLTSYGISTPIIPRQESVSKSADPNSIEFQKNHTFYQSGNWTDYPQIAVEEIGYMRGERLFALDFCPIRYNHNTNTIEVITSADLEVTFANADYRATEELKAKTYSPAFASMMQNTILNYESNRLSLHRYPMSYVIVTPNSYISALQPFIDWKKKEGYNVIIGTTETIGTTTNAIKTYMQNLWNAATPQNPAPSYLLIVGDVAQVPAFTGQTGSHVTDLPYVRLQGTDYVPELYFGRFSAITAAEVTNQVTKTLMHEQYSMPSDAYLGTAVMIAGVDSSFGSTHANGQINYGNNNYFNAAHGITSQTYLYPGSGSADATIVSNVSAGVGYVNYTAHGSETSWADPTFTISNINGLQNTNEYPVVVGNCCLTNAFDTGVCFGEAWLRAVNKGAVIYIGGTNSTYWDEDYYWGVGHKPPVVGSGSPWVANRTGAYDAVFHDHNEPFADWAATAGAMTFMGNLAVVASNSTRINYYWEIYSIMGDPSLGLYMGVPQVNNVTVQPSIFIGVNSLQLTVDPYSYVAISMNGNLHGVGLADASGNLTLSMIPFDQPGTANLVVTRSLRRPAIMNIDVVPNAGPYVMVSTISVTDGNNNLAEAGETLSLNLTVNNVGIQNATDLNASISSENPYVTILEDSAQIDDINAGATVNLSNVFEVAINPMIPDMTNVVFNIVITDGTNTWTSNKTLNVAAPNVVVSSVTYQDSNNNNINEAGENITVNMVYQNTGHMTAEGGQVFIQLGSDQATIANNTYTIPAINPEATIPLSFQITIANTAQTGAVIPIGIAFSAGSHMVNYTAMIPIGVVAEGFETNNFTSFPWVNNSSSPWTIVTGTGNTHSGTYAAKSGAIGHSASTTLQVTMNVAAAGNITFWRKVSSESNYDWLKFSIDSTELGSWSGTQDWAQMTYPVTAGNHTFKWVYSKDNSYVTGSDCAWIDDIVFPMSGNGQAAIAYVPVTEINFGEVEQGEEVSADFVIRNLGNVSLSGLISIPDMFSLSSLGMNLPDDFSYSLQAGSSQVFTISMNVTSAQSIEDVITITSNDPLNPVIGIDVILEIVDNDDPNNVPLLTKLEGNYPNPFNPETAIRFSTKESGLVSLKIYNLRGQLVRNLIDMQMQSGNHSIVWNGKDDNGRGVSSGIYLYRMETPSYSSTKKMMLMK